MLKSEERRRLRELEELVRLFELFKSYVEMLTSILTDPARTPQVGQNFSDIRESLRLELEAKEAMFIEWHAGDQVPNPAIFSLVSRVETYSTNATALRHDVFAATKKFEDLIRKKKQALEELREEITLLPSETNAGAVTTSDKPSKFGPTGTKIRTADELAEIGFKWASRLIQVAPWAKKLLHFF